MIFNYLSVAFEVIALIINYFVTTVKSIYRSLTVKEKCVEGEIVLITGAGHGIGREMAVQYAQLGATVVCWDMNEAMNKETVEAIKTNGGTAHGYT